jgi:hypothetical protein
MMRRYVIAAAMLAASTMSANADKYRTYGVGTQSCGYWTKNVQPRGDDYFIVMAWVLGFVSGVGYAGDDILQLTDADALESFVTNYCLAHPLDHVSAASRALVGELARRAQSE